MATPRFAWGIDIGNRALKAIKLVREGDGVRIDDFEVIEHEFVLSNAGDNRETLVQNALAAFAAAHPMKGGGAVAVGVSGQQSFARFIKLPPVEARKIPEIVRFEAIQQIPFPLDEVEWAYQLFHDEASPDVEVGIFAMRKDLVNQHIGYFTAAGIPVQAVQMNPLSVYNAMYFDQRLKGTTMIIDLGAENADLIITEGESIWLRSIPIGGNNFTEALTKAFKLRFEKAEELKRNAQTSKYGRQILQAMRPVFADLVAEIQRSIGFYSSVHRDSRIQRVLALGGTFKLPGLQKYLQQNLSLEVQKVDALGQTPPGDAKVAAALNDNLLSSVGAYGLALQALGEAKISSSLLPQVIRRERMWREKTKWFAAAAACFVVGAAIPYVQLTRAKASHESTQAEYAKHELLFNNAKQLSDDWAEVEKRGGPDRDRITQVNSFAAYHDTWPKILKTIEGTLPPPPPTDPNELKKTPRDQRQHVVLEDLQAIYLPDLSHLVATDANGNPTTPDSVFYGYMVRPDPNAPDFRTRVLADGTGGAGTSPYGTPPYGTTPTPWQPQPMNIPQPGAPFPQGGNGYPIPEGAAPPVTDPNAAPATPAAPQRGFVLTLHLATPYARGDQLVHGKVVAALRQWEQQMRQEEQRQAAALAAQQTGADGAGPAAPTAAAPTPAAAAPTRSFSIPRLVIADNRRIEDNIERRTLIITRAREAAARKAQVAPLWDPGDQPGQHGSAGTNFLSQFTPPPTNYYPGQNDATGAPGVPGQLTPEEEALLVDPLTGESVKGDWGIVVLAAVVIDPPPAAPPAATPPAQ